ncbi:RmlC-like cupin [Bimuria novae-zelandiae CBS 107.79]|uniref:RmlC-like cupin n=1 Tax=Bimuria novae-zelandiae CBS 107.79 TaxID=1447943 RepID=A0A6A5VFK6_9PLEO|nr:RmlC-like cupin [Bimuria novae-zelandiae CBS 107.79]
MANNGANNSIDTVDDVIQGASKYNAVPLWPQMVKYNPPKPNPKCVPFIWRYDDVRPYLLKAGELVKENDAERRVLMLIKPERGGPYKTDTLYAGLQLVMPNETAPAHRHTAFALRFVIEGNGGFTAVHGQRIQMNHGSGSMIWLDGLDLPQFQHFPVHFAEHFKEKRYPATNVDSRMSPIVFPWAEMKASLDREPGAWVAEEYRKFDGNYERIDAGKSSETRRETTSCVYHVISGNGHSMVGEQKLEWKQGDMFCIPSWYRYQLFADKSEAIYLYHFDDKPIIEALGFYRNEKTEKKVL